MWKKGVVYPWLDYLTYLVILLKKYTLETQKINFNVCKKKFSYPRALLNCVQCTRRLKSVSRIICHFTNTTPTTTAYADFFFGFFLQIWAKAILKSHWILKIPCFHKMNLYTLSYQSSFSANEETYFKVILTIMKKL